MKYFQIQKCSLHPLVSTYLDILGLISAEYNFRNSYCHLPYDVWVRCAVCYCDIYVQANSIFTASQKSNIYIDECDAKISIRLNVGESRQYDTIIVLMRFRYYITPLRRAQDRLERRSKTHNKPHRTAVSEVYTRSRSYNNNNNMHKFH